MKNHHLAAIDIGNTRAKIGIFFHDELINVNYETDFKEIKSLLDSYEVAKIIVSSVNKRYDQQLIIDQLKDYDPLYFNYQIPLPIEIKYDTPQTLGVDRIAAAVGASVLYPGENVLSIDCGSCITYDLLQKGKYYLGGAISPGIHMKIKALHTFTARLPLIESKNSAPLVGKSTEQSILSGIINGSVAEIDGMIAEYKTMYPVLKVVLCGGDALFFDSKVKGTNFVVEDLVLFGLNQVLLYNA
ncbi:MAG: type III pantothenate kinase [Cyclobacteriaceae bacterium]